MYKRFEYTDQILYQYYSIAVAVVTCLMAAVKYGINALQMSAGIYFDRQRQYFHSGQSEKSTVDAAVVVVAAAVVVMVMVMMTMMMVMALKQFIAVSELIELQSPACHCSAVQRLLASCSGLQSSIAVADNVRPHKSDVNTQNAACPITTLSQDVAGYCHRVACIAAIYRVRRGFRSHIIYSPWPTTS